MTHNLEIWVERAQNGDQKALEQVIHTVKDQIYNLSLKMLLFPEDAQDATQEVLIRIITSLSTFQGQSKFTTWVYRVTCNYLFTLKGKQSGKFAMSFEQYGDFIDRGQSHEVMATENAGELKMLEEEVKISCTQGMLLCLDPASRLTYVLGDILELNSFEGAEVLNISPQTFRKRLSRSRSKVRSFVRGKCGLINQSNSCRCHKKIDYLVNQGLVDPKKLRFSKRLRDRSLDYIKSIDEVQREWLLIRSNPQLEAPPVIEREIKQLLKSLL